MVNIPYMEGMGILHQICAWTPKKAVIDMVINTLHNSENTIQKPLLGPNPFDNKGWKDLPPTKPWQKADTPPQTNNMESQITVWKMWFLVPNRWYELIWQVQNVNFPGCTLSETNITAENWWLEDHFPLQKAPHFRKRTITPLED